MNEIFEIEEIIALEKELESLDIEYAETLEIAEEKGDDAPEWDLLIAIMDDILDIEDEIRFIRAELAEDTAYFI